MCGGESVMEASQACEEEVSDVEMRVMCRRRLDPCVGCVNHIRKESKKSQG